MSDASPLLSVQGLIVDYGKVRAVTDVSLTLVRGEITTIVGSNGAGKSTILKAITGLAKPTAGRITFAGQDLTGAEADRIVERGISMVPEGRRLFPSMTVLENLELGAYLRRDTAAVARDLEQTLAYFPVLKERLSSKAMNLSGGQQQMLAVGRALMASPKLLILDEPSVGLAPTIVRTIADIIRIIRQSGTDVLLVEQNAQMALALADTAYVLENGRVAMTGPAKELAASDHVRRVYLSI
ncbi:MAG: ABC transporter ATP-binding protein [Hyphomicrobiaceae bacterium]|nr:ABC transporter ATP-binding protein [Hyphomicrobiaceae bacterium]